MTVLIDSDILIEVCRGRDAEISSRWLELSNSETEILYSPVSAAELWAGALPHEYRVIEGLFRALVCIPMDAEIGRQAGDFLRVFRKSHGIGLGDALIAATAVVEKGTALWTRNRKHYPMKELSFY
jgi:predicted nucleic acid-binding protein